MFKFKYAYSTDPKKCLNELSDIFGEKIIDRKILSYPKKAGEGYVYMTEVVPGVAVMLIDINLKKQAQVESYSTAEDLFILQYDLSDEITLLNIDDKPHNIGYKINLGFSFMDSNASSNLMAAVDSRFFALRLIVNKDFIYKFTGDVFLKKKQYFFLDHIDSNSTLLIKSLKEKNVFDGSFEFYLKGVALELLANMIERYSEKTIKPYTFSNSELDAIGKTKQFLLDNLYSSFPSTAFLAEMAGMSESKYKILFKNIYQISPMRFFIRAKVLLAGKLLSSGVFASISEITRMLNYTSFNQFSDHYLSVAGSKPSEDFIKRPSYPICVS